MHDALFFAIVAAVVTHVAFALSKPDQLVSMFNGRIPRSWAKSHAGAWWSELEVSKGDVSEAGSAEPRGGSSP